MRVKVRPE